MTWNRCDDEPFDWFEGGEGVLDRLIPVREELLRGDFRSLYLGWIAGCWGRDDMECEPPVPPGLDELTPAQSELAEKLDVDCDYLAAAADLDVPCMPREEALRRALSKMKADDARAHLLRVANGDASRVMIELNRMVKASGPDENTPRRTHAELTLAAKRHKAQRERRNAEARERERKKKEAKRRAHLKSLIPEFDTLWTEIEVLAESGKAAGYDRARDLLRDLQDAYGLTARRSEFDDLLRAFRNRHSRRSALNRRIADLG